jgi:hypothetical protein
MPSPAAFALALEVTEAELELRDRLVADRIIPAGARRLPFPHELDARVRFAELEEIVQAYADRIAAETERTRDAALDALALELDQLADAPNPYAVVERLNQLASSAQAAALPGLAVIVEQVAERILGELETAYADSAEEVYTEATRQGVPAPTTRATPSELERVQLRTVARTAAYSPVESILATLPSVAAQVAITHTAASVVERAVAAAELGPRAKTLDAARQAANVAHGAGRKAATDVLPTPERIYASELLDKNTCHPCARTDGREYSNVDAALMDYPGAGGYIACDGGHRCRGTLVYVWPSESPATIDDRRPPDEPVRPTPPPPPPPAAPPRAPRAASDMTDDELVDELTAAYTRDDLDRADELAAELDRRDDLAQVTHAEPKLTPRAELDPVDAWREVAQEADDALDDLGFGKLTVKARTPLTPKTPAGRAASTAAQGRLVDRVSEEWTDYVYIQWTTAEEVARGSLIRRDRLAEFRQKYGGNAELLFTGPARVAGYYASDELLDYWRANPRLTFAEFAVKAGVSDRKTVERARKAAEVRDAALFDRNADRRKTRKVDRRPESAGDRLRRDQERAARERKREQRIRKAAGETDRPAGE